MEILWQQYLEEGLRRQAGDCYEEAGHMVNRKAPTAESLSTRLLGPHH